MSVPKIFESEFKFCQILWENEPISSVELSKLCKEQLGWAKTTTYTVIKRLRDRGVVNSENTIVTSLISKEQAQEAEVGELIDRAFSGSLPEFVVAFAKNCNLTDEQFKALYDMIDTDKEGS